MDAWPENVQQYVVVKREDHPVYLPSCLPVRQEPVDCERMHLKRSRIVVYTTGNGFAVSCRVGPTFGTTVVADHTPCWLWENVVKLPPYVGARCFVRLLLYGIR